MGYQELGQFDVGKNQLKNVSEKGIVNKVVSKVPFASKWTMKHEKEKKKGNI